MRKRKRVSKPGATLRACPLVLVLLSATLAGPACAADDDGEDEASAGLTAISPIFGQLVAFTQPPGFVPAFEQPTADRYIREVVLKDETAEDWTQMITVTGAKGLAADPEATPKSFASRIVGGFERACPDTFAATVLSETDIGDHDAFAAVASCGTVGSGGGAHSETALIVAIKGASDYYTIQWAERAEASADALTIDAETWKDRLDELSPIRLCAIVPGERAPYPSCVDQN